MADIARQLSARTACGIILDRCQAQFTFYTYTYNDLCHVVI
jgi:hypothetical protein